MPSVSFWVLVSAFLFTLMSLSAKLCTGYFDPFEIVFWRSLFGLSLLTLVMLKKGIAFSTQHPWSHAKRSIAGLCCFTLEVIAVGLLPLSVAQSINYTSPLIFCLFFTLSSIIHRTKIDWPIIGAILFGFTGVLLISKPATQDIDSAGILCGLAAAVCGAAASLFLRDLGRQGEPSERAVFYFMLSGLVLGGLRILCFPNSAHLPTADTAWPLLGVMTSGVAAQVLWTYAWSRGHSLLNAVFEFSGIFFGVFLGWLCFNEHLDWLSLTGIGMIFSAGLYSSLHLKK